MILFQYRMFQTLIQLQITESDGSNTYFNVERCLLRISIDSKEDTPQSLHLCFSQGILFTRHSTHTWIGPFNAFSFSRSLNSNRIQAPPSPVSSIEVTIIGSIHLTFVFKLDSYSSSACGLSLTTPGMQYNGFVSSLSKSPFVQSPREEDN